MAATPGPAASGSRSWRTRPGTDPSAAGAKKVNRVVLSALALGLTALLVWFIFRPVAPAAHFLCLPIVDYDVLAVPPIPFIAEDAAASAKAAPDESAVILEDLQTSAGIAALGKRLEGMSPTDVLVLSVTGQGVSDGGAAYLLCSDYLWKHDSGRCEIGALLDQLHQCRARIKLLILSPGNLAADPRLGMLVNEFPRLVEEKVRAVGDPALWVLMAGRPFDAAPVSHSAKRSVFSYYLTEGLGGAADENGDGTVGLAELVDFVHSGVAAWSGREGGGLAAQSVCLLQGGQGPIRPPSDLALLALPRRRAQEATDADSAKQATDGGQKPGGSRPAGDKAELRRLLGEAWALHDRCQSRQGAEAWSPIDYAPHLWREFEGLLLGYEWRYRSGKAFDPKKLAEGLRSNILPLKETLDRNVPTSGVGKSTVLDRLAVAQQRFLEGAAGRTYQQEREEVKTVRAAVQLKNDLLFRAPYYLRWRAQAARTSQRPTRVDKPITDLLAGLHEFLALLEPVEEAKLAGQTDRDLELVAQALDQKGQALAKLRDTIQRDGLEKDASEVKNALGSAGIMGKEGYAARIEALLCTPLLPAAQRAELLGLLDALGNAGQAPDVPPKSRLAFQPVVSQPAKWQRDRLLEQARFEVQLVRLADPAFPDELPPALHAIGQEGQQSPQFWEEYRGLGARLGAFYEGLPDRINGSMTAADRSDGRLPDRLLRVVDARDGGRIGAEAVAAAVQPLRLPQKNVAKVEQSSPVVSAPTVPDRVDLLVSRVSAVDVGPTDPAVKVLSDGHFQLRPFPNRVTSYRFELVNRSLREKAVRVQLLAPTDRQSRDVQDPWDSAGNLRPEFQALTEPIEMPLPADPRPQAIPFPEPKAQKADKTADKPESGKAPSPPEPALRYGLLCAIRDAADGSRKWVNRVELSPLKPSAYLEPNVRYDAVQGRITVDIRPIKPEYLPPLSEENPIRVVWRTGEEFGADTAVKSKAAITAADQTAQLFADVRRDPRRVVEAPLTVDGYPRAFVYRIRLDGDHSGVERERSLRNVRIRFPAPEQAFSAPLKTPIGVEFQVDAPEDAFLEAGERVELKIIERDRQRELVPEERKVFFSDRQADIRLAGLKPRGEVKLSATVSDFTAPVNVVGLENVSVRFRVQLLLPRHASLQASGSGKDSDEVEVVLDGAPPELRGLSVPAAPVLQGDDLSVTLAASDLSGIKEIQFGLDLNNSGKLEDNEVLARLSQVGKDGRWTVSLPTKDVKPGRYTVLAHATDRVGHASQVEDYVAIAQPPTAEVKKTSDIEGRVVLQGGDPLARISVRLIGTDLAATTDDGGRFSFKNVPHGTYRIRAEGVAAGHEVGGSLKLTLPATSDPAKVELILDW